MHVASLHDRDKSRRLPGHQLLVANGRLRTGFLLDINDRKSQIIHRAMRRAKRQSGSDRSRLTILFLDQLVDVIGHAVKLLCANDKIDVRQIFEQRRAARLGHAAEKPENHVRPFFRQPPEHAHLAKRFLVSHVAHAACVQEDDVGLRFVPDPLVAERRERMRDLFGVALVHLAAISLDEEFRHGGWKQYIVTPHAPRAHYRLFNVSIWD